MSTEGIASLRGRPSRTSASPTSSAVSAPLTSFSLCWLSTQLAWRQQRGCDSAAFSHHCFWSVSTHFFSFCKVVLEQQKHGVCTPKLAFLRPHLKAHSQVRWTRTGPSIIYQYQFLFLFFYHSGFFPNTKFIWRQKAEHGLVSKI